MPSSDAGKLSPASAGPPPPLWVVRGKDVSEKIPSPRPAQARYSVPSAPQRAAGKQTGDAPYAPQDRVHDRYIRPALGRMFHGNCESNCDDAALKWPLQAIGHDPSRAQPERLERFGAAPDDAVRLLTHEGRINGGHGRTHYTAAIGLLRLRRTLELSGRSRRAVPALEERVCTEDLIRLKG